MRKYKQGAITDANNVTADKFSHESGSQIQNSNVLFTSEKRENLDGLVDAVKNLTINDAGYELNTATVSGAQGDLTSNP